jgi:hypothetical protein
MAGYVIIVFFFVFSPAIVGIPINAGKMVVTFLFLRKVITLLGASKIPSIQRAVWIHALLISTVFAVSTVFYAVSGGVDFLLPYSYLVNILENLLGGLLLVMFFRGRDISIPRCFMIVMLAFSLQVLIMVVSLVSDQAREFFFKLNANGDAMRNIYDRYNGIRGVGLSSGVTFDLSSAFYFVIVLLIYVYAECRMQAWKFYSMFGVMVLGIVISGRTGLLGMVLLIPLVIYKSIFAKEREKRFSYFKIIAYGSLALCTFMGLLSAIIPDKFAEISKFAFELFINAGDGSARTDSTDTLLTMLSRRISYETLLFGDGRWVDRYNPNYYYNHIDVGYFRHIFYYGVFATFFQY